MAIEVNTNRYTGVRKITIKNHDGSTAGTITIHDSKLKKQKKLQYKFKRISTQIIQAKTSGNARQVLTRAKGETVSLRRKVYTGDYDRTELRRAIRHAEQMERIAKKRMKHLQQAENREKGNSGMQAMFNEESLEESFKDMAENFPEMSKEEIRQLLQELQELQEELAQLEQETGLEELELTQAALSDMDPAQLEQLKKKHRAEELREIAEADMKYLKALFNQMEREQQEASSSGVSLELSGVDIPIQIDERSAAEVASSMPMLAEGGNIDVSV